MELSAAARHFGRAFCDGDEACVERVGLAWERDVVEKMGGLSAEPVPDEHFDLISSSGEKMGALHAVDGTTTVCLETSSGEQCTVVGFGSDATQTALNMLKLQGVTAKPREASGPEA